jgi:hypothetical protein
MDMICIRRTLIVLLMLNWATGARAQTDPSVLFVASERLTNLALNHQHYPGFARLGFGTTAAPWHRWFGASEMHALLHLPGHEPGAKVELAPGMLLGNGFAGRRWKSAFAALASFDTDGNGIVEGEEMGDLYLWVDFQSSGSLATRDDALRSARDSYAGFDLRAEAKVVNGHARTGRLAAFSGLRRGDYRSHLVELSIDGAFANRDRAYLSHASLPPDAAFNTANGFNGQWRWEPTNIEEWQDDTSPWGENPGGSLLLAVTDTHIRGVVQYVGAHGDHINLPLEGVARGDEAAWTSVSPLGLTRSNVRLDHLFGRPVLRGRAWSNRNGRAREWTWNATYERQID